MVVASFVYLRSDRIVTNTVRRECRWGRVVSAVVGVDVSFGVHDLSKIYIANQSIDDEDRVEYDRELRFCTGPAGVPRSPSWCTLVVEYYRGF
jgi:hypothetical protein